MSGVGTHSRCAFLVAKSSAVLPCALMEGSALHSSSAFTAFVRPFWAASIRGVLQDRSGEGEDCCQGRRYKRSTVLHCEEGRHKTHTLNTSGTSCELPHQAQRLIGWTSALTCPHCLLRQHWLPSSLAASPSPRSLVWQQCGGGGNQAADGGVT